MVARWPGRIRGRSLSEMCAIQNNGVGARDTDDAVARTYEIALARSPRMTTPARGARSAVCTSSLANSSARFASLRCAGVFASAA